VSEDNFFGLPHPAQELKGATIDVGLLFDGDYFVLFQHGGHAQWVRLTKKQAYPIGRMLTGVTCAPEKDAGE